MGLGFGVLGFGFRVRGLRFRVMGLGIANSWRRKVLHSVCQLKGL